MQNYIGFVERVIFNWDSFKSPRSIRIDLCTEEQEFAKLSKDEIVVLRNEISAMKTLCKIVEDIYFVERNDPCAGGHSVTPEENHAINMAVIALKNAVDCDVDD